MGLGATKSVFEVSDRASFKPVSTATETSYKIEISPVASLDMIDTFQKANNKGADQIARMQGWSAPVLFKNPRRQVFSRQGPNIMCSFKAGVDYTVLKVHANTAVTNTSF